MQTAAHLTDNIGGRLTNSPAMREAETWTQQQFRDWGLSNVRTEGFEFGRGWSIVRSSARMTEPRVIALNAIPIAWTPGTNGTITAGIVVAPMTKVADFERYRGQLRGKIVLVTQPTPGSEPAEAPFRRLTSIRRPPSNASWPRPTSPRRSTTSWPRKAPWPWCACRPATAACCTAPARASASARRRKCPAWS